MVIFKIFGITFAESWFRADEVSPCADVVRIYQVPTTIPNFTCSPFLTRVAQLNNDQTAMWNALDKSCRYEIRRARERDKMKHAISGDFSIDLLDEFLSFQRSFALRKRILMPLYARLRALWSAGLLVLSNVSTGSGDVLVWHCYIVRGNRARLLYSSQIADPGDQGSQLGRANRLCHWLDMCHFMDRGISEYDLGGIPREESSHDGKSIGWFKRQFGGKDTTEFFCERALTPRGLIFLWLRNTYTRIRYRFKIKP